MFDIGGLVQGVMGAIGGGAGAGGGLGGIMDAITKGIEGLKSLFGGGDKKDAASGSGADKADENAKAGEGAGADVASKIAEMIKSITDAIGNKAS